MVSVLCLVREVPIAKVEKQHRFVTVALGNAPRSEYNGINLIKEKEVVSVITHLLMTSL